MKSTRGVILLRLALAAALAATPVTAAVAQDRGRNDQDQRQDQDNAGRGRPTSALSVPVSGTVAPQADPTQTGALSGTLAIQRFARSADGVVAIGTLTASFTDPATSAARTIVSQVAVPLDQQASGGQLPAAVGDEADLPTHGPAVLMQPACDVLHLVLGPLDLNLLGLRIQLNQVVLDITAVPGAGNLLGNLLCAVVGLLDAGGPLARLVAVLNELLDILS